MSSTPWASMGLSASTRGPSTAPSETTGHPLVDPVGGEWGVRAGCAIPMCRLAPPSNHCRRPGYGAVVHLRARAGRGAAAWAADGCDVLIKHLDREGSGRGMVVQLSADEFLCIGVSYSVQFRQPRPSETRAVERRVGSLRTGSLGSAASHAARATGVAGWPLSLQEPGVARVFLGAEPLKSRSNRPSCQ